MNCKPGDLAIMIYANGVVHTPRNIGRICRVDSPYGIADTGIGPLFHWNVTMVGSLGRTGDGRDVRSGQFPDKYLRPIPGEQMTENIEEGALA